MKPLILIIGKSGQFASSLLDIALNSSFGNNYNIVATSRADLDICDINNLEKHIKDINPQFIVNCAAYTDVEGAEDNECQCDLVNAIAPSHIARAAHDIDAKFIHISSDYVYADNGRVKRVESDALEASGVYAKSKLRGEQLIVNQNPQAIIIRTSWLYSIYGKNFVKTISGLANRRDKISVVDDQYGSPTFAHDFAVAIIKIIDSGKWYPGIYNYCNDGAISWYEFAKAIVEINNLSAKCDVTPIKSSEYPSKVVRPKYSAMNCQKIVNAFGVELHPWRSSLEKMLQILNDVGH